MKISTSTLGMDAVMTHKDVELSQSNVTIATANERPFQFNLQLPNFTFSAQRQAVCVETSSSRAVSSVSGNDGCMENTQVEQRIVGRVVSEILSQQAHVRTFTATNRAGQGVSTASNSNPPVQDGATARLGSQLRLYLNQIHYQEETLSVSTTGMIETADGRTINIDLGLDLERVEYEAQEYAAGLLSARFIDPLVLSFDEGLGVLGDSQFSFDLDCDGSAETISCLRSGCGFLVFDQNGDGKVNNGSELFGPTSGYGYRELQIYDTDNNNWIDENDSIFDRLQLWMGGGSEDGRLVSLREAGVGALSLASVGAGFQLKAPDGRILGRVDNAGIFLTEGGEVRPMTEIDLAVDQDTPSLSWPEFSEDMQESLRILRKMMIDRHQRMMELRSLVQEERWERRKVRLLEQLFALRDNLPDRRA